MGDKVIITSESTFKETHLESINYGFMKGVDVVLRLVKMSMPEDKYIILETAVQGMDPYIDGKVAESAMHKFNKAKADG